MSETTAVQAICIGWHTIDRLRRGEDVIVNKVALVAADDLRARSPEGWPSEEQIARAWKVYCDQREDQGNAPDDDDRSQDDWDRIAIRAALLSAAPAAPASGAEWRAALMDCIGWLAVCVDPAGEPLDESDANAIKIVIANGKAALASPSPPGWEEAREALQKAETALNDWLVTYAGDCCSEEACEETRKRISELGTIGYITSVQETISAALRSLPAPSPASGALPTEVRSAILAVLHHWVPDSAEQSKVLRKYLDAAPTSGAEQQHDPRLKKHYHRVVVCDEDGSFFAHIAEFPGCFATGMTTVEAITTLEDVADSWLQACDAQGQDIPEPAPFTDQLRPEASSSPSPAPPGWEEAIEACAEKDEAYRQRNHLVAAMARLFPSGIKRTDIPGWWEDWHGCCFIDLPSGQISYHYHDSHAHLFDGLPPYTKEWDGHDKEIVHARLASLTSPGWEEAREAAAKLMNKLDAIQAHPSFSGIWGFLEAHGYRYVGPNWKDELEAARAALRSLPAPSPSGATDAAQRKELYREIIARGKAEQREARYREALVRARWLIGEFQRNCDVSKVNMEILNDYVQQIDAALSTDARAALRDAPSPSRKEEGPDIAYDLARDNGELRAALETIASMKCTWQQMPEIARAALAGKG